MYISEKDYKYLLKCKRRAESVWKAQAKYRQKLRSQRDAKCKEEK